MTALIHAYRVSRAYPGGYMWTCLCGHRIFQTHDEMPASIHSRLLYHANGEDGLEPCPSGCGRIVGVSDLCPEECNDDNRS